MADTIGVVLKEQDQSASAASLGALTGAMAIYSAKGPTDKAYLVQSQNDITQLFGNPHAQSPVYNSADLATVGVSDYGRGLQNAMQFVAAGMPLYLKRAISSATPGAIAQNLSLIPDANVNPHYISLFALGHGAYYNNLRFIIAGIESVSVTANLTDANAFDLKDIVMPGTLSITVGTDNGTDSNVATSNLATGNKIIAVGLLNITTTYKDTSGTTTLAIVGNSGPQALQVTYQRTNASNAFRLYITTFSVTSLGTLANATANPLESYLVSPLANGKDDAGNVIFMEDVINSKSRLIRVAVDASYLTTPLLPIATNPWNPATVVGGEHAASAMSGGSEGVYASTDTDIVTALNVFSSTSAYDIVNIFDAGYTDQVKVKIATVCASRLTCVGWIDPVQSLFVQNGNKALNITDLTGLQQNLIAWRMALSFPGVSSEFVFLTGSTWGVITDTYNAGRKLLMPPSFYTCSDSIQVDNTLGSGKSVMGPRRGLTGFEKLVANLYDQRAALNVKQCNPLIVDERGIQMYYGNKTCKPTKSAMQDIQSRKTRSYLSRDLYFATLDYIAEDIDANTINELTEVYQGILAKYAYALDSYSIVVGPPKTTDADIANELLRVGIGLIFKNIAEEIEITTTVFKTGTDLTVAVV